jgi:hypothetical protein
MNREDAGGDCKFELCVSKMRLLPVAFGSRKTKGKKVHFTPTQEKVSPSAGE